MNAEQPTNGPNVKKLIAHKLSTDAVPNGGGPAHAVAFLSDPDRVRTGLAAATAWVKTALAAIRMAAEPNPWKAATDEAIAGEILSKLPNALALKLFSSADIKAMRDDTVAPLFGAGR